MCAKVLHNWNGTGKCQGSLSSVPTSATAAWGSSSLKVDGVKSPFMPFFTQFDVFTVSNQCFCSVRHSQAEKAPCEPIVKWNREAQKLPSMWAFTASSFIALPQMLFCKEIGIDLPWSNPSKVKGHGLQTGSHSLQMITGILALDRDTEHLANLFWMISFSFWSCCGTQKPLQTNQSLPFQWDPNSQSLELPRAVNNPG